LIDEDELKKEISDRLAEKMLEIPEKIPFTEAGWLRVKAMIAEIVVELDLLPEPEVPPIKVSFNKDYRRVDITIGENDE